MITISNLGYNYSLLFLLPPIIYNNCNYLFARKLLLFAIIAPGLKTLLIAIIRKLSPLTPDDGVSPESVQIANVVPEQGGDHQQEMWLIHVSKCEDVAVCCTRTECEQVLQSCEHAKECC